MNKHIKPKQQSPNPHVKKKTTKHSNQFNPPILYRSKVTFYRKHKEMKVKDYYNHLTPSGRVVGDEEKTVWMNKGCWVTMGTCWGCTYCGGWVWGAGG
jgi:hypothetical protein